MATRRLTLSGPGRAHRLILPLLLLLGLLAQPGRVWGQATPADSAAILLDAATRLAAEGRRDAAAELLAFIRAHYAATPAGAEAARRLAAVPTAAPRLAGGGAAPRSSAGRTELVVWGTTYGIGVGLAAPRALNHESSGAYGVGLLLGAPAGYFASRAYADATDVPEGEARAITFGGTFGAWQGYGWAKLAGILDRTIDPCPGGVPPGCTPYKDTDAGRVLRSLIAGSALGIGAGAVVGNNLRVTPGGATTVNLAALWGTAYGAGTVGLLGVDDGDAALAGSLLGGDAALLASALAVPRWRLTRERARLISIAGLAGVLAGGGIDLILQVDDPTVGFGIPMAGGALGLALGAHATRNMPQETAAAPGRGPARGDAGGALLRLDGGRLGLALPVVAPTLRQAGPRPRDVAPALYLPLLNARF